MRITGYYETDGKGPHPFKKPIDVKDFGGLLLRAYGNSINAKAAQAFIEAYLETERS